MMGNLAKTYRCCRRRGFTIMEAALTTIIVGVGTVATMQLMTAGTMANTDAADLTVGLNLAGNVREMMQPLRFKESPTSTGWGPGAEEPTVHDYDDLDDFQNRSFTPPLDVRRQPISAFANWTQTITLNSVDPNCVRATAPNGTTNMSRVTVSVSKNGQQVCQMSWLAVNDDQ